MNKIDPEQAIHVAGVYGPWTAKPWMLRFVKDMNPYNSRYFFWVSLPVCLLHTSWSKPKRKAEQSL
jgi:hypothetical protein